MKKLLVVGVIVLFLGLALAPSINANISNTSIDSEFVEISVEISGMGGVKPHTVKLTKEDAEEVEQLIDAIEKKLETVETREGTIKIYNEAIVELEKYGLLGSLSVEQVQKLIVDKYSKKQAPPLFETRHHEKNLQENQHNLCCIVSGNVQDGYASSIISTLGYFLTILKISSLFGFIQRIGFFLILIGEFTSIVFPFSIMKGITLFSANLTSLGLLGYKKHTLPPHSGTGKIFGFNGIKLTNIETGEINLLGFALAVIDFSNDCYYLS